MCITSKDDRKMILVDLPLDGLGSTGLPGQDQDQEQEKSLSHGFLR
jgi:hypothetical protein